MNILKDAWKKLVSLYGSKDEIHTLEDFYRVKRWAKTTRRTYLICFILAGISCFITLIACIALLPKMMGEISQNGAPIPTGLVTVVCILAFIVTFAGTLLVSMGLASMWLNRKSVIKTLFKTVSIGYKMGEQIQTTHTTITQETDDTYRVSSYTENQGCLFAVFGIALHSFVWAAFCVYLAPYLTFKKYKANTEEIKAFQEKQPVA